jgi:UDP-N-acetylglucosamine:LPS N-acetylglucosamine transferase
MVIDDLANRDTPAQVVLNPNPLFSPEPYQRQKIPHILCGEKYTLIRPEVVAQRDRPYSAEGVIMITLGGGDVVEPLLKVLRAVPKGLPNRICVSVSSACPLEPINAWIDEDPVMRFLNIDSDRFPDLLAGSAMTITGGGTTLWEAYCLGVPNICLVWVDNQRQTSVVIKQQATSLLLDIVEQIGQGLGSDLVAKGVRSIKSNMADATAIRQREQQNHFAGEVIRRDQTSFLIDSANEVDADLIGGILQEFRNLPEHWQEMMSRQRALIDGSGAARCADLLERIVWEPVDLLASDWRKAFENWTT